MPINPGNSGGPLFNMKGEVVGINSLIFSRTGGYMGLAFAIPIDVAMNVVKQIQDKGRVTRGRIGVQIQEVSRETADAFGLPKAERCAGQLGGKGRPGGQGRHRIGRHHPQGRRQDGEHLVRAAAHHHRRSSPARKVTLQVWRKGAHKDVTVTVAELKEDEAAKPTRSWRATRARTRRSPIAWASCCSDLTDEQKKELDLKNGVVVEDITRNARAATFSRAT